MADLQSTETARETARLLAALPERASKASLAVNHALTMLSHALDVDVFEVDPYACNLTRPPLSADYVGGLRIILRQATAELSEACASIDLANAGTTRAHGALVLCEGIDALLEAAELANDEVCLSGSSAAAVRVLLLSLWETLSEVEGQYQRLPKH